MRLNEFETPKSPRIVPGSAFDPVDPDLEDVYFTTLAKAA